MGAQQFSRMLTRASMVLHLSSLIAITFLPINVGSYRYLIFLFALTTLWAATWFVMIQRRPLRLLMLGSIMMAIIVLAIHLNQIIGCPPQMGVCIP